MQFQKKVKNWFSTHEKWANPVGWGLLAFLATVFYYRHLGNFDFSEGRVPQDFNCYLQALAAVLRGESPYDPEAHIPYKYSPGLLGLFYLLPSAPISAWLVAKLIYVVLWVLCLGIASRIRSWKDLLKLSAGIFLSWKGILEGLDYGQLEFVFLFISLFAAERFFKQPLLSGLLIGIAPWIKIPWGITWLPLLLLGFRTHWKILRSLLIGIFISCTFWGLAVPLTWFGPSRTWQYMKDWYILLKVQPAYLYYQENMNESIWATAHRFHQMIGPISPYFPTLLGALIFIGLFVSVIRSTLMRATRELPIAWMTRWLLVMILVNPHAWRWSTILVVGAPFAIPTSSRDQLSRRQILGVLVLGVLILLQQNPVVRILGFRHWTELHDLGLMTVYWLMIYVMTLVPDDLRIAGIGRVARKARL